MMKPSIRFFLPFLIFSFAFTADSELQNYRFDGKYGLYVNLLKNEWEIKWFTAQEEVGMVKTVYGEINTASSINHQVKIPLNKGSQTIQFGGEKSGMNTLRLETEFDRKDYDIKGVDSLYVLGDTHGNFNEVTTILKNAGLIDDQLEWTGGKAQLVFVGDIMDRGDDCVRLAWFIYDLEHQAKASGGDVHLVLGNHEIMVMSNDLRYLSAKEKAVADRHQISYQKLFDPKITMIGKWLASKPAVLKIDQVVFAHGGYIINNSLKEINDQVYEYLAQPAFTHLKDDEPDFNGYAENDWKEQREYFYGSYSPFWFRGYAQSDTLGGYLDFMLENTGAKIHIVGHTPQPVITEKYDGKCILTNVENPGTEMLLLVRNKKKYKRYRIEMDGKTNDL